MIEKPHRRFNPLVRDWVLVSPHRARRPWLGQVDKPASVQLPAYDPTCYLCPGNERAGGVRNPQYEQTFVFENDFAALLPTSENIGESALHSLLIAEPETGICRVICFSPRHDLTLPEMSVEDIQSVIQTWQAQSADLGARADILYVQVFENKGAIMGCSNPHPHSQVWATAHIPNEPSKELVAQREYFLENGRSLLSDYLNEENQLSERILASNAHFTVLVPYWAVWPFETLIIAHRPGLARLTEMTPEETEGLAEMMKFLTVRYDNLFEVSFPYSMGFHQAPFDGQAHPEWTLHAHFYPPLLRSAEVKKFMVGYEMLAMPQRDITPEVAAERLRSVSGIHYKQR